MANPMKRVTAMVLALILILGQVALPVIADDSANEPTTTVTKPEITIDITDGSGNVIGSETSGQVKVETPVPNGLQTDITDYSEGQTAVSSNGGIDAHAWGEESTESETNTKTESSQQNQPVDKPDGHTGDWAKEWDEPTKTEPGAEGKTGSQSDTKDDMKDDGNWTEGTGTQNTQFQQVSSTPNESTAADPNPVVTPHEAVPETVVIPYHYLSGADSDDVTLDLTPDGSTSAPVTREVYLQQIKDGHYPDIYDPATAPEGYTPVFSEYTEGEQFKGWKVTYTKQETGERTQVGGIVTDIISRTELDGSTPVDAAQIEAYENLIASGGTESGKNAQGQDYTRKVEKIEKNGKEAYKETLETVISSDTVTTYDDTIGSDETNYPTVSTPVQETPTFTPPAPAPAETTTYHGDGTYTQVTVTKLYDDQGVLALNAGDEVGYTVSTVLYDKDGSVIESSEQDYYGTRTEKTVTTTLDPTTKKIETTTTITERKITETWAEQFSSRVEYRETKTEEQTVTTDTIEDTFELVQTADGMFFVYTGTMSAVTGSSNILLDYDTLAGAEAVKDANGNLVTKDGVIVLKNSSVDLTGTLSEDDLRMLGEMGITLGDQYTGKITSSNANIAGASAEDWRKIGIGLQGGFTTWDDGGFTSPQGSGFRHTPQQYMIFDGEHIRFVYCVELGKSINESVDYASQTVTDPENNNNSVYGNAAGTIRQVSIVATNGFWGTREGLGSLEAVKQLLIDNGLSDVASRLTDGKAMAATQLALWEFAHNSSGKGFTQDDGNYVTWDDSTNSAPSDQVQEDIHALRNLLISMANDTGTVEEKVEQITASSITGGAIVVKETVYDQNGQVVTDGNGNAKYGTDMQFQLSVSSNSITGNLTVAISDKQSGKVLAKARLAGDDSQDDSLWANIMNLGTIRPDANGVYTLENVELFAGQEVNIKLEGIQMLENGVYIYKNDDSQDFLGLATKKNNVDLNFTMSFNVVDPALNYKREGQTVETTNTIVSQREDTRIDTINITFTKETYETDTDVHKKETILGTKTVTTGMTERTKLGLRWNRFAHYDPMPIDDDPDPIPGGPGPDPVPGNDVADEGIPMLNEIGDPVGEGVEILDEEVPLAAAPGTGDASLVWAAMSVMSLGGYTFLGKKEKKTNKGGKYLKK